MNNLPKFHNSREYAGSMKPLNDQRFANSRFKTGPLQPKKFNISPSDEIFCIELSNDETFFITGGYYEEKGIVLKLSMRDVFGIQSELKPTVIHNAQYSTLKGNNFILCLAISPDDRRIISGGFSGKVLVHDIQRGQLLHDIPQSSNNVWGISVQPSSHNGDVFALGNIDDGVVRIYDSRCSTTVPTIETEKGKGIFSVAFSPTDTTNIAVAGRDGAKIIDIRQPNQDLLLLSSADRCSGIHYNSKGDRLIFLDTAAGPQVIDLASFISGDENEGRKKLASVIEKDHNWTEHGTCCFAGANDELVVAASLNDDVHVWSVPEGQLNSSTDNQQIMHLTFDDQEIRGIFYSKHRNALISCGNFNQIKTWTAFKLPQLPSDNGM